MTVMELNKAVEEQRIEAEIIMLPGISNTEQDVVRGSLTNQMYNNLNLIKHFYLVALLIHLKFMNMI